MTESNEILVGKKPLSKYVLAVVTQFNNGNEKVVVKARGRMISKAVDCVQMLKNKFIKDLKIDDIKIGTEILNKEGKETPVSYIEIHVSQ